MKSFIYHLVDFILNKVNPVDARRFNEINVKRQRLKQSGGVYPSRIIVAGPTPVVRGWGYALASYPPDHTAPGHIAVLLRNRLI